MIIMLCRNNVELSKRCLATLLKQDTRTILLIDNASSDGTVQWMRLAANADRVWYQNLTPQRSVAQCWNLGLEWAFGCTRADEEVLVVNNDTELRPDTYSTLRHHLSVSGAGMMTCISVRERERMQGNFELSVDGYRPHPDFSCFMISKACYERVGLFNEAYEGAFAEDAEYHVRMHRAGVKALNCGLPFLHHGSQTVKRADEPERKRICEAADRNRELFYETYGVRIGSQEYSSLFTEDQFGIANTTLAEPVTHPAPSAPPLARL